jgi:hypothetical protein
MNDSLERVVSGRAWEEVECAPVTESTAVDPRVITRYGRPGQLLAGLIDTVEAEIVPALSLPAVQPQVRLQGCRPDLASCVRVPWRKFRLSSARRLI